MRDADLKLLARSLLFGSLPEAVLARLTRGAFVQTLPKGALLFSQGDEAEFLHVILSGRVALTADAKGDASAVIEFFQAGDVFIAPAVILELPYLMSASVVNDARILMIPGARFRECMEETPQLSLMTTRLLATYWRKLIEQIKHLKLMSTTQRLGAYLLALAGVTEGTARFRLNEERKLLATRLAMTPESLSRAFARLRDYGVAGQGHSIEIEDAARLRRYVDGGLPH